MGLRYLSDTEGWIMILSFSKHMEMHSQLFLN